MTPPITDTQRRFLVEVAKRLPRERVQEVYLFNPMKQGGIETGVAVFAAGAEPLVPPDAAPADDAARDEAVPGPGDGAMQAAEASDPTEAAAHEAAAAHDEPATVERQAGTDPEPESEPPTGIPVETDVVASDGAVVSSEVAPDEAAGPAAAACVVDGEVMAPAAGEEPVTTEGPGRITIITARYRLQLKGPDRGKWEVDVVEEADAPLVTVDVVVRGVQRRAGELSGVERLDPEAFAAALDEAPWKSR